MKRTLPTLITLFAVTVARASDIATTFHFNPSLSQEANPIVAQFGAGASTMVLTNVVGVFVFLFVPLFFYWRFPSTPLQSIPANVREFICLQLYGRLLLTREFFRAILLGVPLPKNWLQILRFLGIALPWTMVFGSFLEVFAWWASCSWHWRGYGQFRAVFAIGGYPTVDLILCVAFFFMVSFQYFRGEFSSFRNDRST
ncbi:MAG: signal peptide protein [Capsulimonas sp.]|nr:signal peptide protein [Capsulimonas sp.]